MSTQPEALRLINNRQHAHLISWQANACAELRRLHEENTALRQSIEQAEQQEPVTYPENFIDALRYDTALRDFEPEQAHKQEPVEWITFIPLYTAPPVASNDTSQNRVDETAKQEHEPVAWMHNHIKGNVIAHRPVTLDRHPEHWTALYPEPKPCQTCEALARTVMLDQTSHDTFPPPRQPLTDEQIKQIELSLRQYNSRDTYDLSLNDFARAIEAACTKGEA